MRWARQPTGRLFGQDQRTTGQEKRCGLAWSLPIYHLGYGRILKYSSRCCWEPTGEAQPRSAYPVPTISKCLT